MATYFSRCCWFQQDFLGWCNYRLCQSTAIYNFVLCDLSNGGKTSLSIIVRNFNCWCPRKPLQWCHNEVDGISNRQPYDCLLSSLFNAPISKKTLKLCVTGLCEGNSPVTSEFPTQRTSYVENVSIWWRHHAMDYIPLDMSGNGVFNGCDACCVMWIMW